MLHAFSSKRAAIKPIAVTVSCDMKSVFKKLNWDNMLNFMEANGFVSSGEEFLVLVGLVQTLRDADASSRLAFPSGCPLMIASSDV